MAFPTRQNPSPTTQIPVVDFSQSEEVVVKTWRKACLDHGFLYGTQWGSCERVWVAWHSFPPECLLEKAINNLA